MQCRILFSLIVLFAVSTASGQVPERIHYQGRLIESGGLVNDIHEITIRLYDAETGPTELYAETQTVTVVEGLYSFALGANNATPGALTSALMSTNVWLEVNVTGQTLTPRERLGAVAYALATRELLIDNQSAPNVVLSASRNTISSATFGATIGGGSINDIGMNSRYSSVGGGHDNNVGNGSEAATIAGGKFNNIGAGSEYTTVGGGSVNIVADNSPYTTLAGGYRGGIGAASGYSTLSGGGDNNVAGSSEYSTISGGAENSIETDSPYATIGGGTDNRVHDNSPVATIAGGSFNYVGTNSLYATIPGGHDNEVGDNASYAFAAGRHAKANHQGTFVWADSTDADVGSTTNDEFAVRAAEGVRIVSEAGPAKTIEKGRRFKDNAIIAWGRVRFDGNLDSEFGVTSVTKVGTGRYDVVLNAKAANNSSLIPVVSPEIDNQPSSAGSVRIASYNTTGLNAFSVYMNNGTFAAVDDDFTFIVTGR